RGRATGGAFCAVTCRGERAWESPCLSERFSPRDSERARLRPSRAGSRLGRSLALQTPQSSCNGPQVYAREVGGGSVVSAGGGPVGGGLAEAPQVLGPQPLEPGGRQGPGVVEHQPDQGR